MGFCTKCGRPRAGDVRFCAGCGTEFPAATPTEETQRTAVPLAATPLAAEGARFEPIPVAADPAPAPGKPDPFASWSAEPSPADGATRLRGEPADRWKPEDTITARPAQATAYPPPSQPSPSIPPPTHPVVAPGRSGGGRMTAFIIAGILVALAAGGGVYALVSRSQGHATAQPPSHPAVAVGASTAPVVQASTSPTAGASASPSTSPSASATPSPAQSGTVQVAPGVASNPAASAVGAFLNRYFNSINTRNYSEYNGLLDAQKQQSDSQAGFDSGFATTKDSNEVLTGITGTGGGNLMANVSFTSHQNPADSVDHSACNNWRLSLYLVPQGNRYLLTAAPPSYTAAYADC